ncbi:MAG: TonB-dependent receptor [Acidobacteria bacterium]|nr:TonB-dependent receptor [Acidobacteriota bacterium]
MKARLVLAAACLAVTAFAATVSGQSRSGTIYGTITDATGGVLPGATVIATNTATTAARESIADARGRFEFPGLPIGMYSVKVALAGFSDASAQGVELQTQQEREVNFKLSVSGIQETTTVTGVLVEIERRTGDLAQVINSQQVADLPLNGRNFVQLGTLATGAVKGEGAFFNNKGTTEVTIRGGTGLSVQGMRENSNDYLIDGVDNNELTAGAVSILPSIESIQEFKVLTNNYSAQYGSRGGGTVLVSTKSGSNTFHGSAFEFLRNDALDAKNYFEQKKGTFNQNQFGGSVGGPIFKNKTFFFADYMGFKIKQAIPVLATVPTLKMRQGDFSESFPGAASRVVYDPATTRVDPATGLQVRDPFPNNQIPANRIDPIALQLLNLYPLPLLTDRLSGNYPGNPIKEFSQNYINGRIDQNLSNSDTLFGRFTWDRATQYYPYAFPYGGAGTYSTVDYLTRARNFALAETHVFSSHLLNQATAGYNYVRNDMTGIGQGQNLPQQFGIPGANNGNFETSGLTNISLALGFTSIGDRSYTPFTGGTRIYHFADTLTKIAGPHTMIMGGSIRMMNLDTLGASAYAGSFAFSQLFTSGFNKGALDANTGSAVASLLLGLPASGTKSQAFAGYTNTRKWQEYRIFLADTWQLHKDLTLDLGLAYNLTSPIYEAQNRFANLVFDTGKWLIAGDNADKYAGVKWDKNNVEPRMGFAWVPFGNAKTAIRGGYGIFHDVSSIGGVQGLNMNPPFMSELGFTSDSIVPVRTLSTGFPAVVQPNPATYTGNVYLNSLDYQQGTVQMFNANVQRELFGNIILTVAYAGTRARNMQSKGWNLNAAPPGPGTNAAARRPYPQYNNFNVTLGRGTLDHNSLQVKAERRMSKGLYVLAAYTFGKTTTNGAGQNVGVGQGTRYYPYEPYEGADLGASDTDARHVFNLSYLWRLPIGRGEAWGSDFNGFADAVLGNWQINGIIRARTGLPLAMTMATNQSGSGVGNRPDRTCDGQLPENERTILRWFNTSCYVAPAVSTFGNAKRTEDFSGPGLLNVDLSIFKSFSLGKSRQLEFRVETFNLFNTTQFANPGTSMGSVTFGQIQSTMNPARQIQLALKFVF